MDTREQKVASDLVMTVLSVLGCREDSKLWKQVVVKGATWESWIWV